MLRGMFCFSGRNEQPTDQDARYILCTCGHLSCPMGTQRRKAREQAAHYQLYTLCDRGKGSPEIGCFKTNNTQLLAYAKGEPVPQPLEVADFWESVSEGQNWPWVGKPGRETTPLGPGRWARAYWHNHGCRFLSFTGSAEGSLTPGICNLPARTLSPRHRTPSFFVQQRPILYCTSFFWILNTSSISWSHLKFQSHIFPHAKSDFWISLNMKLNHY